MVLSLSGMLALVFHIFQVQTFFFILHTNMNQPMENSNQLYLRAPDTYLCLCLGPLHLNAALYIGQWLDFHWLRH